MATRSLIFRYLQNKTRVCVWLYDNPDLRMEGQILGFDEFMNLTLDEVVEVSVKKGTRTELGRLLLKGDNITLITALPA
ncbi:Sme1p [Paramicrosporidium saccamoebae]|uniref:Small nuclear ribonucleoprotein E n=1 Tax=Paramicrosporidium saccamoebae TaxID=1246581 RepID=A0A2H9TFG2_9FUNG|nr:Sme1p [Paramicrosporidium saccamoebae]